MLIELARPLSLLLCIFSIYGVFYSAFLMPAVSLEQRIWLSLELLSLAAAISIVSGFLFREPTPESDEPLEVEWRAWRARLSQQEHWPDDARPAEPLLSTLPVQLFCWATGLMTVLFILAWYLETYYLPYRNLGPF